MVCPRDPINTIMKKVSEKYKDQQTAGTNSPSDPNTRSFTASHSGGISHERGVVTHSGHGGMFSDRHDHFLKIGGAVPAEVHKKIVTDIHNALIKAGHKTVDYKGQEIDHSEGDWGVKNGLGYPGTDFMYTKDKRGNIYVFHHTLGRNWGGVGITKKPRTKD